MCWLLSELAWWGKGRVDWSTESRMNMVRSASHGGRVVSEGVWGQSASLSLFLSALIRLGSLRGKGMEWGERKRPEQRRGLKWSWFDVWDKGGRNWAGLALSTAHWQISISTEVQGLSCCFSSSAHTRNTHTHMLTQSHATEPSRKWDGAQISSEIHYTANLSQTHTI